MNNRDRIFYHIYPLGLCGAPKENVPGAEGERLRKLFDWADYLRDLGVNSVYLGPVFESVSHGYNTTDFYRADGRLGTNDTLRELCAHYRSRGIGIVLDAVFNHVGRRFAQFEDVRQRKWDSPYKDWFDGLDFSRQSPLGDPFDYRTWAGHYDLVKLNLRNPEVKRYLFDVVSFWTANFDIDGLRLDAADSLDFDFMSELAAHCRALRQDFFLLGEVVHGDYNRWANPARLDTVTNYECYKGLWSGHNDANFFEIAYTLNRQFGPGGIYRSIPMYNFADNHDVPRVASSLRNPADLFTLYLVLFTMPGMPSVYYGSEWGMRGTKEGGRDDALRPAVELAGMTAGGSGSNGDLYRAVKKFAQIRTGTPALRCGDYRELHVSGRQLAFARTAGNDTVVVAVNSDAKKAEVLLKGLPGGKTAGWDVLNGEEVNLTGGRLDVYPHWGRIVALR